MALGATPIVIGILSAIPAFAQLVQLPAVALAERVRQRRKISVVCVVIARALILSLALLPLAVPEQARLGLLLSARPGK